jgi:hypothetical protein
LKRDFESINNLSVVFSFWKIFFNIHGYYYCNKLNKNFTLIKGIAACNGTIERPIKLIASLRPGVFLGTPQFNGGLLNFHVSVHRGN